MFYDGRGDTVDMTTTFGKLEKFEGMISEGGKRRYNSCCQA